MDSGPGVAQHHGRPPGHQHAPQAANRRRRIHGAAGLVSIPGRACWSSSWLIWFRPTRPHLGHAPLASASAMSGCASIYRRRQGPGKPHRRAQERPQQRGPGPVRQKEFQGELGRAAKLLTPGGTGRPDHPTAEGLQHTTARRAALCLGPMPPRAATATGHRGPVTLGDRRNKGQTTGDAAENGEREAPSIKRNQSISRIALQLCNTFPDVGQYVGKANIHLPQPAWMLDVLRTPLPPNTRPSCFDNLGVFFWTLGDRRQ